MSRRIFIVVPIVLALVALLLLPAAPSTAATTYTITNLGTMMVTDLNANRQIVGTFGGQAVSWQNGTIAALSGHSGTTAYAVNDASIAVGSHAYITYEGNEQVSRLRAARWENGEMSYLLPNETRPNVAYDINASGAIAIVITGGEEEYGTSYTLVRWTPSGTTTIGTFISPNGTTGLINDTGVLVTISNRDPEQRNTVATRWQNGQTTLLTIPADGADSTPHDINGAGQIVGSLYIPRSFEPSRAFVWQGSSLQELPPRTAGGYTEAFGINDQGVVVGASGDRAVRWQNNAILDLNTVLPNGTDWTLTRALKINDTGDIIGEALKGGQFRSFLLRAQQVTPTATKTNVPPTATKTAVPGTPTRTATPSPTVGPGTPTPTLPPRARLPLVVK